MIRFSLISELFKMCNTFISLKNTNIRYLQCFISLNFFSKNIHYVIYSIIYIILIKYIFYHYNSIANFVSKFHGLDFFIPRFFSGLRQPDVCIIICLS